MREFINKIPIPLNSLSFAFAILGNLLRPYSESLRIVMGIIALSCLLLFLLRVIFDYDNVKHILKRSLPHSVLGAGTMSLMVLSTYIRPYFPSVALSVWYIAIVIHLVITITLLKKYIPKFDINNVYPTWFTIGVGLVVGSVTSPVMNTVPLGIVLFYVGIIGYVIIKTLVIRRLIKGAPLSNMDKPTTVVLGAPTSLLILGYLSVFPNPNAYIMYILITVALIMYVYALFALVSSVKTEFYPCYAAMTFPFVISSLAFRMSNMFLISRGNHILTILPNISMWIAIAVVSFVSLRFVKYLFFSTEIIPCCSGAEIVE